MRVVLESIGVVESPRIEPTDDNWRSVESVLRIDAKRFGAEALAGLNDFSHIDVVYFFHRVDEAAVVLSGHPRGNVRWPCVGIFAQRKKDRPNRLGVSTCEVLEVMADSVRVRGLDAIDGTPILDIKPFVEEFLPRGKTRQPAWISELMRDYWE